MDRKVSSWEARSLEAAERSGASILCSEHLTTQRGGAMLVTNPLLEPAASATGSPSKK